VVGSSINALGVAAQSKSWSATSGIGFSNQFHLLSNVLLTGLFQMAFIELISTPLSLARKGGHTIRCLSAWRSKGPSFFSPGGPFSVTSVIDWPYLSPRLPWRRLPFTWAFGSPQPRNQDTPITRSKPACFIEIVNYRGCCLATLTWGARV